nr:PREDICTED: uncharacterized protein LOC105673916 [Linepithema humile]
MSSKSEARLFSQAIKYYKIEKDFLMQCKRCEYSTKYVPINDFEKHMRKKHQSIRDYEEENKCNAHWAYFMLTKENKTKCLVCDKIKRKIPPDNVLKSQILDNHARKHPDEELKRYEALYWPWKYLTQDGDFSGECKLCKTKVNFQFDESYYALLKHHFKNEHNKSIKSPAQKVQSWKALSERNSWLKECYTKTEEIFQAKCKFCLNEKLLYVHSKSFIEHVKENHKNIHQIEDFMSKQKKGFDSWKYVRCILGYKDEIEVECMLCQKFLQKDSFIEDHLKEHVDNELELYESQYKYYKTLKLWPLKYLRQDGDSAICTICKKNVNFYCDVSYLKEHMMKVHPDNWKRTSQKDLM